MWNRIYFAAIWTPSGDATVSDVASGKTFYSNSRILLTGITIANGNVCTNNSDCYDSNANARPNQTSGFTTTFTNINNVASYDWDCNGTSNYFSTTQVACGATGYSRGVARNYWPTTLCTGPVSVGYHIDALGTQACN